MSGAEKCLPSAKKKNARQTVFYRMFFFAVRHAKYARQSSVRLKKYARQRSERTANIDFPVVIL
jgi:hypothetical protein